MGIANRHLLLGLAMVTLFGTAVYFRLWLIDYRISSRDTQLLRREFDLAHKEAVDESAEWRYRFDQERERANKCMQQLNMNITIRKNAEGMPNIHEKLQMLQKENKDLLEKLESLKRELETERLKCSKAM